MVLLALCFVLSGLAALVYQTAWTRQFALVFGTSELAVATVLAFVFQLERMVAEGAAPPVVDVPPTHHFDPEGRRQA